MYSVIIPTMWRVESFPEFLKIILLHDLVKEVIIINNNPEKTPKSLNQYSKLRLLNQSHNIGVNPAWNLGVLSSNQDTLCILNDDIEFDVKLFDFLQDKVTTDCGMIGIDMESKKSEINIDIAETIIFGYACLFFIHKKNYVLIPDSLKVFYGDNWLFDNNKIKGKVNKKVSGASFKGLISATSKDFMPQSYIDRDNYSLEFNKLFKSENK